MTYEAWQAYAPVETHLLRARRIPQTFRVQVWRPALRVREETSFPVLYATDANLTFDVLRGISHNLQFSEALVPRFILVGIGYPSDAPWAGALLRGRDLMLPDYPKASRETPPWEGVLGFEEGSKDFHGGEDFQAFLAEELFPFIEARYSVASDRRTYFGHSAGASFGLGTLFTRPELFDNYILSSPATYIDGRSTAGIDYDRHDFLFQYARRFIASGRRLDGVRAYLSMGEAEEFTPELSQYQLTSSFYRMVALIRRAAIPGLGLTSEVFPGERHMTVWPMAFSHGVQAVLE